MVLEFLNKIGAVFLELKLISELQCEKITKSIAKELNQGSFCYHKTKANLNYDEHFINIDNLRKEIIFQNPNLTNLQVENKINYFLAKFLPSQNKLNNLLKKSAQPYEFLRAISLYSYYVKRDKSDQNLLWNYNSEYGVLRMSINKAKPEKTINQIKAALKHKSKNKNKPKCDICIENIGYHADDFSSSKENLRVHFVKLNNQNWFFQYSPYSYLKKHFVLNSLVHQPMKLTSQSIKNLITFVEKNPHFFLGSNADIPIVGGSLLSHDHYQGAQDSLPIMKAEALKEFKIDDTKVTILNWALNALKISSKNKEQIQNIGSYFLNNWKNLDTNLVENNNNNTCTIILNKTNQIFNLYLIFRNNTTSIKRPYGNFHVHQNRFNIKQENIGLMEAAGLAILPDRLESELLQLVKYVKANKVEEIKNNPNLQKHYKWIKSLIKAKAEINSDTIFEHASFVFKEGLKDCKVLTDTKFIKYISFLVNDEIILKNNLGMTVNIISRGFTIKQIKYNKKNYLLEYKEKNSYYNNSILLNSFVAPVAGRIEKGIIKTGNKNLKLPVDKNNNYLHSMNFNCAFLDFNFARVEKNDYFHLLVGTKKIFNSDLNANYNFRIEARLYQKINKFSLDYYIEVDNLAIANPTQHFYFRFDNDYQIGKYKININSLFQYWDLNLKSVPFKLKNLELTNKINTIFQIAKALGKNQSQIVNGLIDHPFINLEKKDIYLENKESKIKLSSKIKDFVLYTHNYPGKQILNIKNKKVKNNAVCVEFQYPPTSLKNPNYDKIIINKDKNYKNQIVFEIIK